MTLPESTSVLPRFLARVAARARRARHGARVEQEYGARFERGTDGVVQGAESFTLKGTNGRALLLLHGSGDTPQTMRYLGERLHSAGYTVHAPLLPGHGRSPESFSHVSAAAYLNAARHAYDQLRADTPWVGVVGLSMGGALAAQIAAHSPETRVLVLLAPYLIAPAAVEWAARTSWAWGLVLRYLPGRGERSVHDTVAQRDSRAYGVFPPRALRALVATAHAGRRALSRVHAPTLVINSRDDNRIPVALATRATDTIAAPTERHWVTGCGHVITIDYCKDAVADLVLAFLARHAD